MTKTIKIEGMGCGGCVKKVKTVLEELSGVESAEVSLDEKTAVVTFDGDVTDEAMKNAIEGKGFEVLGIE